MDVLGAGPSGGSLPLARTGLAIAIFASCGMGFVRLTLATSDMMRRSRLGCGRSSGEQHRLGRSWCSRRSPCSRRCCFFFAQRHVVAGIIRRSEGLTYGGLDRPASSLSDPNPATKDDPWPPSPPDGRWQLYIGAFSRPPTARSGLVLEGHRPADRSWPSAARPTSTAVALRSRPNRAGLARVRASDHPSPGRGAVRRALGCVAGPHHPRDRSGPGQGPR
jgi:hypothetical protein